MISICNTNAIKIKQCVGPSIYKSVSLGWKSLHLSHKPQSCDADPHAREKTGSAPAKWQSRAELSTRSWMTEYNVNMRLIYFLLFVSTKTPLSVDKGALSSVVSTKTAISVDGCNDSYPSLNNRSGL